MKNRRKTMALVRAVQKGQVSEKAVSRNIRFMARNLSTEQIYELLREPLSIEEKLGAMVPEYNASRKEKKIRELVQTGDVAKIGGVSLDRFTGTMIAQVLDALDPAQKQALLNRPVEEAIAIAYKLASRSIE